MSRQLTLVLALSLATPFAIVNAAPEPRLEPGDVLEFSVASLPVLHRRVVIGADGEVGIPLVGEVPAAGATLSWLREEVRRAIQTRPFAFRTADGREVTTSIAPEEVSLNVVEYRPVYMHGDVAKPGQVPFRVGLTIRQAVAIVGGYDPLHEIARLPQSDPVAMRGELNVTWIEYARLLARQERLRRELVMPNIAVVAVPLPASVVAEFKAADAEEGKAREAKFARERQHFERAMKDADRRAILYSEQAKKEEESSRLDSSEFDRVNALFQRNLLPISRVTDVKRLTLVSATRALQTAVQAESARREKETLVNEHQRLEDERAIFLTAQLEETVSKLASSRARLQNFAERLPLANQSLQGRDKQVLLYRKTNEPSGHKNVGEDEELRPGDVVEVKFSWLKPGAN